MSARLQLRGLTKVFPLKPAPGRAVDGLDLELRSGELLVLLGPSGCGKTTTLRLIAGLETPTAGRVLLQGRDITEATPQDRHLAMVFQSPALYPQLTVAENLGLGLKLRRASAEKIRTRVAEVAALTKLEPLLSRRPAELSGGQQQRVALGRAFVAEPEALLLDEPLAGLDPAARMELRGEIRKFQQACGVPAIHVTHDRQEAMALGDRIALMNQGRLEQVGTAEELYYQPATVFAAHFFGSPAVNLIPATVDAAGRVVCSALGWAGEAGETPRPALWAVRPEEVIVGTGSIRGRIVDIVQAWPDREVTLEANGITLRARVSTSDRLAVGQEASFSIQPRASVLFDPATGRRLSPTA